MTRRPPRIRGPIDWEAARRRLQPAAVSAQATRAEAERLLTERAARLSVAVDRDEQQRVWLEVLAFQRVNTRFALESRFVVEVGTCGRLSRVPGADPALLGMTNLRGDLLPVFELATVVDDAGSVRPLATQLIVLGEGEPEFGVLADVVDEVTRLSLTELSDARAVGALAHPEFVRGIGREGRVLLDGLAIMRDRRVFVAKRGSGPGPEREAS